MLYILAIALAVISYVLTSSLTLTPDGQLIAALVVFFGTLIYGKVWKIHYDMKK